LENHADKKPTEIATVGLLYPADCKKSRAQYVNTCRPSWVNQSPTHPPRSQPPSMSIDPSLLDSPNAWFRFLLQVRHFDRQHCAKKRVQRLLDADDDQRGPMSLPQPYTFKQ
jgi:cytochrome c oxidase assembly factor 6